MQDQTSEMRTAAALSALAQPWAPSYTDLSLFACWEGSQERAAASRPGRLARAARWVARKVAGLWRALPGPWWVKAGLLVICLAIPGPGDEIALVAIAGWLAVRKARAAR